MAASGFDFIQEVVWGDESQVKLLLGITVTPF